jgi:hypothetical protein
VNCAKAREQMLGEPADRSAAALAAHLSGCAACRSTQRRLARLERDLPLLRVPDCPPPAALLELVLHGPGDGALVRPRGPRLSDVDPKAAGRQKVALAFALAASLLVFAVGWWAWPAPESPPQKSQARLEYEKLLTKNKKLAPGFAPRQGVEGLTEVAEGMFADVRKASPEKLDRLAQQFDYLAQDLEYQAGKVPASERAAVQAASERLSRLESEAAQLAAARRGKPEEQTLHKIARVVRETDKRLRQLLAA